MQYKTQRSLGSWCYYLASLSAANLLLVASAMALPVFKFDTTYTLNGNFSFGHFGKMEVQSGSTLRYDSNTKQLTFDAKLTSSAYKNVLFNMDYVLGAAIPKGTSITDATPDFIELGAGDKIEFPALANAPVKHGLKMIGTLEPEQSFQLFNVKNSGFTVAAGYDFPIFLNSMLPHIVAHNGKLQLKQWIKSWDSYPKHFDAVGDPSFSLTEVRSPTPPTEVPEPASFGLLLTGLLGGTLARRRRATGDGNDSASTPHSAN